MKLADHALIQDCLGHSFTCDCHKTHTTKLEHVCIQEQIEADLLDFLLSHNLHCIFLLEDNHTKAVCGEALEAYLHNHGIVCDHVILAGDVIPDERTVFTILCAMKQPYDYIIGVGTGTINDLSKFISYKVGCDYAIVATAPSMDGFASVGAALLSQGLKTTYECHVPTAIFADLNVLCHAPLSMIQAGLGDILGKYNCLVDWKVAHIINQEYYCPVIVDMVYQSIAEVTKYADGIESGDPKSIKAIMEALIQTGIAMSFVGNSRPASGSEHHISHYWEMQFLFAHRKPVLHGIKVGIATSGVLAMWQRLMQTKPDFNQCREAVRGFDETAWVALVENRFKESAPSVIALEKSAGKNDIEAACRRLDVIEAHWKELRQVINQDLPSPETIIKLLQSVHAKYRPDQVEIDEQTVRDGVILAKEVRVRYGLLQLLWDLGLLSDYSQYFVDYYRHV